MSRLGKGEAYIWRVNIMHLIPPLPASCSPLHTRGREGGGVYVRQSRLNLLANPPAGVVRDWKLLSGWR